VRDADGKERPVKTPFDWGQRRAHILAELARIRDPMPDPSTRVPLDAKFGPNTPENYTLESVTFSIGPNERVTAFLHVPRGRTGKRPAVICPVDGLTSGPPVAHELTRRGYICLVVKQTSSDTPANFGRKIVRGIDLLDAMPDVDVNRIGVVSHGPVGTTALVTAAFDQRIAATISNCGLTELKSADGKISVKMNELIATLAPRPTYLIAPTKDTFPLIDSKAAIASARKVFAFKKADRSLIAVYPDVGHEFPEAERKKAYEWLDRILKP
jgi:hypothetical protein